jgi:hypothetical protein
MRPEEALIVGGESLQLKQISAASLPPFSHRSPCPDSTSASPESVLQQWNQSVISRLLDIQKVDKHGCFFISLAKFKVEVDKAFVLPQAESYLSQMSAKYSAFLNGLDVLHQHTAAAFEAVLPDFQLQVVDFTLIKDASRLLRLSSTPSLPVINTGNNQSLEISRYPSPVLLFWHQFGGSNSHWTAKTALDTSKDRDILSEYTSLRFPYELQGVLRLRSTK